MKIFKIILFVLLVAFVGMQFIPTELNQSGVVPKTDFMLVNDVPFNIQNKLQVSCYDCHSNNTNYPWYNKIQPIAWFMENHVKEGKAELNFSEWDTYSNRRKNNKIKSIMSQIKNSEMPLYSYTMIHWETKLTESEKTVIVDYMEKLKDNLN